MVLYISQDESHILLLGFLFFRDSRASVCIRRHINIYIYTHTPVSQRSYSCRCCYFRSHYLARRDTTYSASDWLHPAYSAHHASRVTLTKDWTEDEMSHSVAKTKRSRRSVKKDAAVISWMRNYDYDPSQKKQHNLTSSTKIWDLCCIYEY